MLVRILVQDKVYTTKLKMKKKIILELDQKADAVISIEKRWNMVGNILVLKRTMNKSEQMGRFGVQTCIRERKPKKQKKNYIFFSS